MKGLQLRKWYEVTKKVQSYEKSTKLQKRYKITKKVRSYEKGTQLRKRYEVTKKIRSYEKVTIMVRSYEKSTKRLRNKLRKTLVMKFPSYQIVTPPIGIIYFDVQ